VLKKCSLVLCVLLLFSCNKQQSEISSLPFYNDVDLSPNWQESSHQIAEFDLIDHNGQPFDKNRLDGKITIANFFFTSCPGICPRMTANMNILAKPFAQDDELAFLSISVQPWRDNPETLQRYRENKNIENANWHLLTGDNEAVYTLARTSFFADESFGKTIGSDSEFIHTENFYLLDGDGKIRGVYNGTVELEMQRITKDISTLKKELR